MPLTGDRKREYDRDRKRTTRGTTDGTTRGTTRGTTDGTTGTTKGTTKDVVPNEVVALRAEVVRLKQLLAQRVPPSTFVNPLSKEAQASLKAMPYMNRK